MVTVVQYLHTLSYFNESELAVEYLLVLICGFAPAEEAVPWWSALDTGPTAAFHPDNKELPAVHTSSLVNEISYQSASSWELRLAVRSGYVPPSAALNTHCLKSLGKQLHSILQVFPSREPQTTEQNHGKLNNDSILHGMLF